MAIVPGHVGLVLMTVGGGVVAHPFGSGLAAGPVVARPRVGILHVRAEGIQIGHLADPMFQGPRLETVEDINKIVTTKTISKLKKTQPVAGQLYGFLSKKTHIDYKSHFDFLRVENGRNVMMHTQNEFYEYAEIILHLADLYGIVWEVSQNEYLTELESVVIKDDGYSIKEDRPFLNIINDHLTKIELAANLIG